MDNMTTTYNFAQAMEPMAVNAPPSRMPWLAVLACAFAALPLAGGEARALSSFRGQRVRAIAGIGHPQRFFAALEAAGLVIIPQAFADHHRYVASDLAFDDGLPLLMTEKDAVKCTAFAREGLWSVPAEARLPEADTAHVRKLLSSLKPRQTS